MAERSYEIFGKEKRLASFLRTRFAKQGRLVAETLNAYRVHEPFAMTAFDEASTWAVALENLASYDSLCRAVAALPNSAPRPAGVIFGRGTQFTNSCRSLPARLPQVHRLLYVGDLDVAGLEVAVSAQATLDEAGVDLVAWTPVYELMVQQPPQLVKKAPSPHSLADLLQFLDPALRRRAMDILLTPGRVPQESVGRRVFERILQEGPRSLL